MRTKCAARWSVGAFLFTLIVLPEVAFAYRPFDGTDAAVTEPGEVEIEFQPAGVLSSNGQRTLVAPATVLNFGLVKNWEAVFEGRVETPLDTPGPTSLTDAGAFLSTSCALESCRTRQAPASRQSSELSCRTLLAIAASAPVSRQSSHNGGTGARPT